MSKKVNKKTKASKVTEADEKSEVLEGEDINNKTQEPIEESSTDENSELEEAKDKYLRLYSEFENFRRRTAKEKSDLIYTANEELIKALLPVIDDFGRAQSAINESKDEEIKEGINLVSNKFMGVLEQKGLKLMEVDKGSDFDTEIHEAITQIPAPEEKLKGKVIDVIERGYYLGEKVVRYAKVVVGA